VESPWKKHKQGLRYEIDAEGENYFQKIYTLSHEWKISITKNEKSVPSQYGLRFSDQGKFVFSDGLLQ